MAGERGRAAAGRPALDASENDPFLTRRRDDPDEPDKEPTMSKANSLDPNGRTAASTRHSCCGSCSATSAPLQVDAGSATAHAQHRPASRWCLTSIANPPKCWDGYPLAGTLGRMLWEEDARLFEQAKRAGNA